MLSFAALLETQSTLLAEGTQTNTIFIPEEWLIAEEPDWLGGIALVGRDGAELRGFLGIDSH